MNSDAAKINVFGIPAHTSSLTFSDCCPSSKSMMSPEQAKRLFPDWKPPAPTAPSKPLTWEEQKEEMARKIRIGLSG
jgi:hypothetical protein